MPKTIVVALAVTAAASLALVFYFIGLVYFACCPPASLNKARSAPAVVAYATYDLTNRATLKGWSAMLVFIDMA